MMTTKKALLDLVSEAFAYSSEVRGLTSRLIELTDDRADVRRQAVAKWTELYSALGEVRRALDIPADGGDCRPPTAAGSAEAVERTTWRPFRMGDWKGWPDDPPGEVAFARAVGPRLPDDVVKRRTLNLWGVQIVPGSLKYSAGVVTADIQVVPAVGSVFVGAGL